jgi:hypothetical protein
MDTLRKPLFVVALILIAVAVLVEIGATAILGEQPVTREQLETLAREQLEDEEGFRSLPPNLQELRVQQVTQQLIEVRENNERPPGLGIPYLALLDGLVLMTVGLMGIGLVVPERVHGRTQGIVTLVISLVLVLLDIILIFIALLLLVLMVSLFLSVPFGTLTYLAVFGFFDRAGADLAGGLVMALKLGFAGCLVFAHQRFLQNKGLVLLILTSFVASIVVAFLHGIVPGFLVSITDAIAAIVVAILAIIWAIILLVGAIVSVVKVLRVDRAFA